MAFPADPKQLQLPSSYAALPFEQIRVSHVPESSKEATPVVVLTLYRPNNYNAFTDKLMREIEGAFELFDVDDRVKCIVIAGHGKMFCAGADLDVGFSSGKESVKDHRDGGGRVTLAIHRCRKPTVGAIHGSAVGVGITMCLPMTIRVAYEKAKVGFVFARRGIIMEACSSFFLPKLVGMGRALHLVTTGSVYEANNPLFNGLFSELLPSPDKVLPRALELADEIAKNTSVVSTNLMRELMYRNPGSAEGTHLLDSAVIYGLFGGKDNTEGVISFKEKRPAQFSATMQEDAPGAYPWWETVSTSSRPKPEGLKYKSKM
ncbi:hypothetical protein LTR37_001919 [Vermiconidia calcicola]|uniref:Uncharacterized protein n=1 Tax=Vermiconidia calcicola TaxID=1690605 RepID=A0ACC3NUL6_9PEZI|nr:hypothetical protein LTR37_001919 [Vermiconidia calcicola]